MRDERKSKLQLVEELAQLRHMNAELAESRQFAAERQQLRENARTLRTLLSNLPGIAYRCRHDPQWTMEFVSEGAYALTGYQPLGLIGNRTVAYGDLIHAEDRDEVWRAVQRAVEHRRAFQLEYRILTAQGDIKWVWEQGGGVFSDGGELTAIEGFMTDVNESVLAKEALQESERRLNTLIANLPGAVYRCRADADMTVEYLSEGYFALTGCQASELIGQPGRIRHGESIHPDDRQRACQSMMESIARERQFQVEYRIRTAQGEEKWVWERGTGVFSERGELEAIEGFTADITARKAAEAALQQSRDELERRVKERTADLVRSNQALRREIRERLRTEETLRRSEDRYRALVESSPDAIVVCDLQGRITFASRHAVTRHGLTEADEPIGGQVTDLVVPHDRDVLKTNIDRLIREGTHKNHEYTGLRGDGTTFLAEVSASVIRNAAGEPESLMGVYRDITERKEAQEALRRGQEALHRMLQASDRDRELITYDIHDGVAQRLLGAMMQFGAYQELARHPSMKARAVFDAGMAALREAAAEARGLMNRTRSPVLQKFGVQAAIADFISQLGDRPDSPDIRFHCDVQFDRLAPALETALFRVAQEAIANACNHSQSELVHVTLVQNENSVTLEVRDRGKGFDVSRVSAGHYGLDGIRERTRLLGSELRIDSAPGKGTTIRATFLLLPPDD